MEHLKQNSGRFEWYTPAPIIAAVRDVLGTIDLDPASSDAAQKTIHAKAFYTQADDGLAKSWVGKVFLNPPYARRVIDAWIAKLIYEYRAGNVSEFIVLVNNASDTAWAQDLLAHSSMICLLRGRIKFIDANDYGGQKPKGGALQGQMVCYQGYDVKSFVRAFRLLGTCFECAA